MNTKRNSNSRTNTGMILTPEDLKIAADMFIYLNLCPSAESVQIWLRTMSTFFDDLFKKKPANEIILTLNRMMKTKYDTDGNIFAQKIFKRASSLLALKYEEIQRLLLPDQVKKRGNVKNFTEKGKHI